jgi:hypothetical protein
MCKNKSNKLILELLLNRVGLKSHMGRNELFELYKYRFLMEL